jgi:tryptophan-specific transport protein
MNNTTPLWNGILLVAGGALGAGMFALPMVSAGAWMWWSTFGLFLVWGMTFVSAKLFATVNLALITNSHNSLDHRSSFDSLVCHTLGLKWSRVNNMSIVFIMMILMYAYTSAGASIVDYSLKSAGLGVDDSYRRWLSIGFATLIGFTVAFGTSLVSRVLLVFLVMMAAAFIVSALGIMPSVDVNHLTISINAPQYVLAAIPVYVTAFACAGLIPSLVRHYHLQPENVNRSLFWGSFLVLLVYILWLILTFGSIGRDGFESVFVGGGNLGELVAALVNNGVDNSLEVRLNLFSHGAIITSFLSVGLGLFHFIQDKFSLGDSHSQRLFASACCFGPPAIASFVFPYGFIHAIGFAGMFVAFSFFVLPGMMALALKQKGVFVISKRIPLVVILFGLVILGLKSALLFSWLPTYY